MIIELLPIPTINSHNLEVREQIYFNKNFIYVILSMNYASKAFSYSIFLFKVFYQFVFINSFYRYVSTIQGQVIIYASIKNI